jgi:acetyl-CoA acetyltransferase
VTQRRVAIVGAALSDCGRVDDKTAWQLHHQATSRALQEAAIGREEVDGFMSHGTGNLPPIEIAEYLGFAPHIDYIDSTGVGGSCWEIFLDHAVAAISCGAIDTAVLSYGSTSRADLKRRRRTANLSWGNRGPGQFDAPYGHTLIAKHAMSARRHMHEFGTTIEQLAEIAVSTRYNASLNPDAYYRDLITVEEVESAEMIADPLTKLHCCIRSDGGGALVLTHEERARDCATTPVWVLGTGEAISHSTMSEWEDFTESPCVRSGKKAFARAGCEPEDVDVTEIYDSFTLTVLLTLEGLGFCKKGEGGPFVEGGRLRVGGELPTNTDGGGLSACQPGMRGIFLLVEATKQLRGECGARQVPDARLACVNATGGWISSTGTAILGRD